ncbi:MAG TPA: hypothetical protein VK745_30875, partial [Polyangiaceae bacterium]|nr:hypothetical protein [Polyangiaceae bacterium]
AKGRGAIASNGQIVLMTDPSGENVYRTTDGGNTWARFGTGLPRVAVTGMFVARDGSLVRVSTKGRGVWEIHPRSM